MSIALAHDVVEPVSAAGPSPTLVLLGSLGARREMWNPQLPSLSERIRVVPVDLRGHGDSPAPAGPYSIGDLANDVLALVDSLALPAVHLAGLSLGGAVAQWIAVHRPKRVQSLALLCTSARFGDSQPWIERAQTARNAGTESLADTVVARWFTEALAERDPDLIAAYRQMIVDTDDEGYAACCDALSQWDNRADLSRIGAPTLLIAGAQDPATSTAHLELIADAIADADLHVLDPAAHLVNVEQAGAVTKLLAGHVLRSEGREANGIAYEQNAQRTEAHGECNR